MRQMINLLFLVISTFLVSCMGDDTTSTNGDGNISTEFNPAERLKGVWEGSLERPQGTRKITIQFSSDSTASMIFENTTFETNEKSLDSIKFSIQYNSLFPVLTLTDSSTSYSLYYRKYADQMLFYFVDNDFQHFTNYGEVNDIQGVWTTDTMCNHYCDVMNYTYSSDSLSLQDGNKKYTPKSYAINYLYESILEFPSADTDVENSYRAYWIQGNEMWQFETSSVYEVPVLFTQK